MHLGGTARVSVRVFCLLIRSLDAVRVWLSIKGHKTRKAVAQDAATTLNALSMCVGTIACSSLVCATQSASTEAGHNLKPCCLLLFVKFCYCSTSLHLLGQALPTHLRRRQRL